MDIEKQTKKIMSSAIDRYAKEYQKELKDVQLMIKCDNEATPYYQLLIDNKFEKDITFNEVLDVKVDFLGREHIVAPFISKSLRKLQKETDCKVEEINILIYKKVSTETLSLYFFINTKPIKPITFEFIFEELAVLNN